MAKAERTSQEQQSMEMESWISEQYEAGYQARFEGIAECMAATPCWRQGWQEANREIAVSSPGTSGIHAMFTHCEGGTGGGARACGVPFDPSRSASWKRSWVQTDIALGVRETQKGA